MTLGIIGLGLMGGSLSLAIKKEKLFKLHLGFDRNDEHKKEALDLGIVDSIVDYDTIIRSSDVLILAIPVNGIVSMMEDLKSSKKNSVIIDLGSTKKEISEAIPEELKQRFIPAHPMAGTEYSGPKAAFSTLYKNKVCVLCDTDRAGEFAKDRAIEIFTALKMRLTFMDSTEHDRHAAFISHLPHVISYSVANTVLKQEDTENILALAAGGFRDISRLAKSSPNMWRDVFIQNKKEILETIKYFKKELDFAEDAIEKEDVQSLYDWMVEANRLHTIFKPQ